MASISHCRIETVGHQYCSLRIVIWRQTLTWFLAKPISFLSLVILKTPFVYLADDSLYHYDGEREKRKVKLDEM